MEIRHSHFDDLQVFEREGFCFLCRNVRKLGYWIFKWRSMDRKDTGWRHPEARYFEDFLGVDFNNDRKLCSYCVTSVRQNAYVKMSSLAPIKVCGQEWRSFIVGLAHTEDCFQLGAVETIANVFEREVKRAVKC